MANGVPATCRNQSSLFPMELSRSRRYPMVEAVRSFGNQLGAQPHAPEDKSEMQIQIKPIASGHITGFHAALDAVACEGDHLVMTRAPTIESTRQWVPRKHPSGPSQKLQAPLDTKPQAILTMYNGPLSFLSVLCIMAPIVLIRTALLLQNCAFLSVRGGHD